MLLKINPVVSITSLFSNQRSPVAIWVHVGKFTLVLHDQGVAFGWRIGARPWAVYLNVYRGGC